MTFLPFDKNRSSMIQDRFAFGYLFNKAYLCTDLFNLFLFPPIIFYFLLLKIVSSLGINWNYQGTEFFHPAVPKCFRHAEIPPFRPLDFFHSNCRNNSIISVSASTPSGTVITFSAPVSTICGFKFFLVTLI